MPQAGSRAVREKTPSRLRKRGNFNLQTRFSRNLLKNKKRLHARVSKSPPVQSEPKETPSHPPHLSIIIATREPQSRALCFSIRAYEGQSMWKNCRYTIPFFNVETFFGLKLHGTVFYQQDNNSQIIFKITYK